MEYGGKGKTAFESSQRKEREWCFDGRTHSVRALRLGLEIFFATF